MPVCWSNLVDSIDRETHITTKKNWEDLKLYYIFQKLCYIFQTLHNLVFINT